MNLLLDTHTFIWWIADSPKLSSVARELIGNGGNRLYWSAASTWEASIKYVLGRLVLSEPPAKFFPEQLKINRVESLPITDAHAIEAATLPPHHSDPFDRMLISQARIEGLALVSIDPDMRKYGVDVLW
ncbi:MAG: type II toxin-antitoxin system VapC family toxin [Myxococcaceae bacterium]